jgi:hypothetical protein
MFSSPGPPGRQSLHLQTHETATVCLPGVQGSKKIGTQGFIVGFFIEMFAKKQKCLGDRQQLVTVGL